MLKELPPSPLALLQPSHPDHRAARKEIEKKHPHFNTKDLAMKAGILALLAGIACYPRIKAEAEILGGKGKKKLKEEGRKGRKRWDEVKDNVGEEVYGQRRSGSVERDWVYGHGHRRSGSAERRPRTRPALGPRLRSRSEGWDGRSDRGSDRSGRREWKWERDDRRHGGYEVYRDRRGGHRRY
ncbi:uncharacterized protein PAC_07804 [Phialocephala subalpina]|uniref:Uncharacterized protein n=1 Tax=Phialocephala subalpina TaxID=576137 RepID=A0A1L7WYR9_9HELO|nr:uncharacterized protein PAC_07804 [Phialocephala subalpina]